MIYGVTGHRPKDIPLSESLSPPELELRLAKFAKRTIMSLGHPPTEVITGMAEGWDLAVADACVELGLPFCAAIPFEGQERYWSGRSQGRYRTLRALAAREVVIGPFPDRGFYLQRNEWIVNHAIGILALWSGKTDGGTAHCVRYANRWCVPVYNCWDDWLRLTN